MTDTERDLIRQAVEALERCKTVLGNMAMENEGAIFFRWPVHHEPLRADARGLLPVVDEVHAALTAALAEELGHE